MATATLALHQYATCEEAIRVARLRKEADGLSCEVWELEDGTFHAYRIGEFSPAKRVRYVGRYLMGNVWFVEA